MLRSKLANVVVVFVFATVLTGVASACPSCQVGIGDETVKTTLSGYIWSYCFLALCPFLIVSSVIGSIVMALKDDGAEIELAADPTSA